MERFRYDGTQAGRKEVFGPKGRDIFLCLQSDQLGGYHNHCLHIPELVRNGQLLRCVVD